ncbi:hypothetical protein [Nonomuraea sp. NPDC049784]|uniref:hypothetical protein n=1 Tax=Nonomuraea sp. NPDC049784 TaxID=3154361 RepID=UPI003403F584
MVVRLALAPYKGQYTDRVEVDGTRRLCEAAREANVGHLIYTSIIGADRIPWGYFGTKVRTEEIIKAARVPCRKRRPIVRMKLPGKLGAAFRGSHLATHSTPTGGDHLEEIPAREVLITRPATD